MVQKGYCTKEGFLTFWGYLCSFPDCREGAAGDDGVYNVSQYVCIVSAQPDWEIH